MLGVLRSNRGKVMEFTRNCQYTIEHRTGIVAGVSIALYPSFSGWCRMFGDDVA